LNQNSSKNNDVGRKRLDGERIMSEESNPNNNAAKVWRDYFRDIREAVRKGRFSELINPIASGIILTSGLLVSLADFIVVQKMMYRFDLINLVGFVFLPAGLGLRALATRTLGRYFSPDVRILPEHKLIRVGIYKHVRHPIYLGTLLAFFSVPLLFHSLSGFLVMTLKIPLTIYRIKTEERALLEKFGDEYREYIKTSKRLIPYIY
jgi:protein-S-isoprenylcysteine O-methyltransferase Ste14